MSMRAGDRDDENGSITAEEKRTWDGDNFLRANFPSLRPSHPRLGKLGLDARGGGARSADDGMGG